MNTYVRAFCSGVFVFLAIFAQTRTAVCQQTSPTPPPKLSATQIEELAAPIALYPDPLLGLILPASVFPDQIVDAALLIKTKSDAALIAEQSWDASVKGIATYPGVLKMMFEKIDWTARLGNVFLYQSPELRDAIQGLREKAQAVGNLESTEEQKVSTQNINGQQVIRIEPTSPEVVYVPQYSTQVVYTEPAPPSTNYLVPLATFGLGMAIGSAMSDDDDGDEINIYGGYPGRVNWYSNDVDDWADNRQDMIRDSQSHRQDMQHDRTDFRQDRIKEGQDFRHDQIKSGNADPAARNEFRQEQTAKRSEYANQSKEKRTDYRNDVKSSANSQEYQKRKQEAKVRADQWKSTSADRGWDSSTRSGTSNSSARASGASTSSTRASSRTSSTSQSRSTAIQGYSNRSTASAYGSRGSSSRSASGYSRGGGSRSGGSRGGSRGGGGRRR